MRPEDHDWHHVRELARRLQQERRSELTEDERDLLRRVSRDIAVSDADLEKALQSAPDAVGLVVEMSRRIREGSRRLSHALVQAHRLSAAGDKTGARRVLQEELDV